MGIDCFRDLAVTTFSLREGLSGNEIDSVLASRDGTIWAGGDMTLDSVRAGSFASLRTGKGLPGSQVTSLFEDHAGRMWVGTDATMSILKDGIFTPLRRRDGRAMGFVVGMAEDIDNNIWLETSGAPRELIQIRNLQVARVFSAPEMPAARRVAADPKGGIWLGLMSGDLARYRNGKLDTFHFKHGSPEYVTDLIVDADGAVIGATSLGLIAWREGVQRALTVRNGLPCDPINALIRDHGGTLWLHTQCGLVQVSDRELQKWWANGSAVLQMRVFDSADGFQSGFAPFQGAARAPDGNLWFANRGALQMINSLHQGANPIPPPVHIEEVLADHHAFSPEADIRLPALTRDIAIRYTGLSFVAPQKVRFRYMLEGQDSTWQEAGTRREAFYTNLAPRSYRFRVIACNNDGLWNETGDTFRFSIAHSYYQTNWFRVLCAGVLGCALWLLCLLRLRHATDQVQQRMGGRLEERERIARELHDTLLQGFQGLVLRFQAVLKVLPAKEPARQMMELALDRADEVLLEGRQRVRALRETRLTGAELPQALTRCGEELSQGGSIGFSLSVSGAPRPLNPDVLSEAYQIAREGLCNSIRHSRASRIEVELTYTAQQVRLRIRDDGVGIDPVILETGKEGHWGLSGMRERAQRIRAKLKLVSQSGAGTEIELLIRAKAAYPHTQSNWRLIGIRSAKSEKR